MLMVCLSVAVAGLALIAAYYLTRANSTDSHAVNNYLNEMGSSKKLKDRFIKINSYSWPPNRIAFGQLLLDARIEFERSRPREQTSYSRRAEPIPTIEDELALARQQLHAAEAERSGAFAVALH